jgi:hypothetical protein
VLQEGHFPDAPREWFHQTPEAGSFVYFFFRGYPFAELRVINNGHFI